MIPPAKLVRAHRGGSNHPSRPGHVDKVDQGPATGLSTHFTLARLVGQFRIRSYGNYSISSKYWAQYDVMDEPLPPSVGPVRLTKQGPQWLGGLPWPHGLSPVNEQVVHPD